MAPLIGYLDRFSARPGESLAVKVSATLGMPYRADLVRIRHADPNPQGPGMRLLPVPADWAGEYPSRAQSTALGSFASVQGVLALGGAFTLLLRYQPWRPEAAGQELAALEIAGHRLRLTLSEGALHAEASGASVRLAAMPLPRHWYEAALMIGEGVLTLIHRPLRPEWGEVSVSASAVLPEADWSGPAVLHFARGYDGRLEDPMLLAGTAPAVLDAPESLAARTVAWWDFSRAIATRRIEDRGPHGLHGLLHNQPTRAVRGSHWSGEEHCWRHAPRHYAALHFHTDDLADCDWETDFTIRIPEGMRSGIYGVRLRGEGAEDIIPFYVLPPRGRATAPIAFLAPTFTYQAYANHSRGNADAAYKARVAAWGAYPHNPDDHHGFGHSTYNVHPDGSGIGFSSRLRPILTMRPGFLTFDDPNGSGLRHFPADSHLTDWLEEKGFAFDVITDEDLDNEGLDLLRPYKAVLTGTHPEYHTLNTLDALQAYVDRGGRLAYLGGNGFYWRVARDAGHHPGILELRRAEGGIRAWAAEPGEYFHQFDGQLGGLWRRNGRPPQMLAGVGFSAQGLFEGSHYRRAPGADDPRAAWVFEGVPEEIIGDFGLSGGGAAGFELDRADPLLGTPANAVILAHSEAHQPHFRVVNEEMLGRVTTTTGEPEQVLLRADMLWFETPGGGEVFSTGSITFCGSLSHNGYANPVSRILENVVRRFGASDRIADARERPGA